MSHRLVSGLLVALVAVAAIAVAIVLGLTSGGSESGPPQLEPGEPILVLATLSPPVHRLGDLVVARLELTMDPRLVDTRGVDVTAQFAPYELARDVEISRSSAAGVVGLRFAYVLQCVVGDCASEDSSTRIELPQPVVSYRSIDPNRNVELRPLWPTATIVARVGDRAGAVPAEATLDGLPETTYSVAPSVVRGLSIGLAALLVAAVAAWALVLLRPTRRRRVATSELPSEAYSLGRALAALVEARGDSAASQQLALEALAGELDARDGCDLASVARRLAWSSRASDKAELDDLLRAATELEEAS